MKRERKVGGIGSGFGEGITDRYKTDELFEIDIRIWSRRGLLSGESSFLWSWDIGFDDQACIRVAPGTNHLIISYRLKIKQFDRVVHNEVWISSTPCHFGGMRPWFLCPICNKRVAVLYVGERIACRTCCRASYSCQYEDKSLRCWRRARKLRAELGRGNVIIPAVSIEKPKGMHWHRYESIVAAINHYEKKATEHPPEWLRTLAKLVLSSQTDP